MQDPQLTRELADYRMCPRMLLGNLGTSVGIRCLSMTFPRLDARSRGAAQWRKGLVWATLTALLIVCLTACGSGNAQEAPGFQVTLFDGTEFKLSDQAGQNAVVVNFWYPTCPPCQEEMPAFEAAWQQIRDDEVQFLGIYVPQGLDTEQDARDFVNELGLTYGFATDLGARIAQSYELEFFPTTYFIDKSGRIFKAWISLLDQETIVGLVRQMTEG